MFKKCNYSQNFSALNFAITYAAIIFTAAISQIGIHRSWAHGTSGSHRIGIKASMWLLEATYWSTGYFNPLISQIGIQVSCAQGNSDSQQIWYLSFYANPLSDSWKWHISVHRLWYLPYKSNRNTWVLGLRKLRFTTNSIFKLIC